MMKEDIFVVIELSILKWRGYPGLSKWTQCNPKDPYNRRVQGSKSKRVVTKKTEGGMICFGDRLKGH